jgi:glycine cleavage system regulatory protein
VRTNIIFSFIGEDHPGLVDRISEAVEQHNGNWLASRLSQLGGKFAGIIQVGVEEGQASELVEAIQGLSSEGLSVLCEQCGASVAEVPSRRFTLQILGLDRSGIVHEVSHALTAQQINVAEMSTTVTPAAMTGELMFNAQAIIEVPSGADIDALEASLDIISGELTVEIDLEPNQD